MHIFTNLINNDSATRIPQQNRKAMLDAPKLTKELLKIDWNKSAKEIHNLIRGLSPFLDNNSKLKDVAICPSAWFLLKNRISLQRIHMDYHVKFCFLKFIRVKFPTTFCLIYPDIAFFILIN